MVCLAYDGRALPVSAAGQNLRSRSGAPRPRLAGMLVIDPRFCGPPATANGGYLAGLLASGLSGPVEVTLRAPAPIGRPLDVVPVDAGFELRAAGRLLASARPAALEGDIPDPPGFEESLAVAGRCRAFETHPFPHCFVCGPERAPGDGMRVFPGWLPERGLAAAAWVPDASLCDEAGVVRPEFVWAALDCPSAFPLLEDPEAQKLEPLVLGRLTAWVERPLRAGQRSVLSAWAIELGARKGLAGTALHDESGTCLARALATWISLAAAPGA